MALITTIEEIKKHVSQLSTVVRFGDIEPDIHAAFREELYPFVGASYPDTAPASIKTLLQEALANFAVYRFSMKNPVQLTASGMQSISNENFQSAAKYDKFNFRDMLLATAYSALEMGLSLAAYENDFKATPQYKSLTARLLNFTSEIESYKLDFTTFQLIKKHIALIEKQMLQPLLGSLYNELRQKQYVNENGLSDLKTELLGIVRDALGQYAIELAFEQNIIAIVGHQVSIKALKDDDARYQAQAAPLDLYTLAMKNKADFSARYFSYLKDFLKQNAEALGWTAPTEWAAPLSNATEQIGIKTLG